jgi:hypothetical protein
LLGPLLVAVVARELGPVLINLIVIVRSDSAMTTELGVLKINGEVRALERREAIRFCNSLCRGCWARRFPRFA